MPCPACGELSCRPAFNKWGFEYVTCESCTTLYLSPRPEQKYFEKYYRESTSSHFYAKKFFLSVAEIRRKKLIYLKAVEIVRLCEKDNFHSGTFADVGAGDGILLEELKGFLPDETRFIAIESNPEITYICRMKSFVV